MVVDEFVDVCPSGAPPFQPAIPAKTISSAAHISRGCSPGFVGDCFVGEHPGTRAGVDMLGNGVSNPKVDCLEVAVKAARLKPIEFAGSETSNQVRFG
jgi:hypothetical protein